MMRFAWQVMLATVPFAWTLAGFAGLNAPPTVDRSSTLVVSQFLAERGI